MWAPKIPQPGQVEQKIKSHLSNDCWRICLWYCYQHDKNVSSSLCNLRLATRVIHILSFTLYLFDIDTVYVFKCLVTLISCLYFRRYCDSRIFIRNFTLGTGRTVWFHQGPVGSCCTFRKKIMIDKFSEYYDLSAEVSLKLQNFLSLFILNTVWLNLDTRYSIDEITSLSYKAPITLSYQISTSLTWSCCAC